ncbi:MAG: TonB-dependent receptor [Candidatus Eremiobacteraeota bacterium]|nr:TonB-dependent receptor [Candidatus Eremiobacteraeota bacterium]
MLAKSILRAGILTILVLASQATWTLAGTTGAITGNVWLADGTPVAAARVTATAPSETANALSDAHGHYGFLSLAPDTYKVTASKEGYETVQQIGVTVLADQVQTANLVTNKAVATIGKVTVLGSATALVSKSQTANVYAVNAAQLTAVQAAGGGNNMENAYSALDIVPGIYHFLSNAGWGQTLFIHGGNYTEVGYEYDGVPVNRAFDQYNGDTLSSLGNQQVQVYTGGAPASSSSSTVSGFINQVIKTGTYPGYANLDFAVGSPSLWNGEKFEIGGAAPDRMITYYAGVSNYSQGIRVIDNFNGGQTNGPFTNPSIYPTFSNATPFGFGYAEGTIPYCNPDGTYPIPNANTNAGCYARGLPQHMNVGIGFSTTPAQIYDHEGVVNLHFAVPHPHDGSRDDIQALYSGSYLVQRYYSSTNDAGGLANVNFITGGFVAPAPVWPDGFAWPDGTTFGQGVSFVPGGGNNNSNLSNIRYLFPQSPTNRAPDSQLPLNQRDGEAVGVGIGKLQYTHNMGSNAFLRVFGYSLYSDWLQNAPNSAIYYYQIGLGQLGNIIAAPDYELSTHTFGGELQFQDQINDRNLINFTTNYATAHSLRYNNREWLNSSGTRATVLSDANGNCYALTGGADPNDPTLPPIVTGAQTFCDYSHAQGSFGNPTRGGAPITGAAAAAGASWKVAFLGPTGTYNTVKPRFITTGLSDQFRASNRLLLNVGIRFENYNYDLSNMNTPDNNFWFHAAAQEYCYDPSTGQPVRRPLLPSQTPPAAPWTDTFCPTSPVTGQPTVHPDGMNGHLLFTNVISGAINHSEWLPRFGGTYTINDNQVIRFNYGRYAQPVETAFTQYAYAPGAGHNAAAFNFVNFWGLGFTTPRHDLPPITANNYDFSFEQRLPRSDVSFRLTPFFRSSHGEFGTVSLGPNFASGYPYANEQVQGIEFQTQAGNPAVNGLSGLMSFTYTHATIKLTATPTGQNAIDVLNGYVDAYNALTAGGNVQGLKGAPCYNNSEITTANPFGVAAPGECVVSGSSIALGPGATGGTIINPYFFGASQARLDRSGTYLPYQTFPNNPLDANSSNTWPYLFSGYVSYKRNKITFTPTFSLQSGDRYGGPTSIIGYDPRTCLQNQGPLGAGVPTGNPGKANFASCQGSLVTGGVLAIPNPTTGSFDSVGQYTEPWTLNINAQISAELSPMVTARLVMANVLNKCFGGSSTPWSKAFPPGNQTCFYGGNGLAVSNFWNGTGPNDPIGNVAPPIPQFSTPYQPEPYGAGFNPFQMTFQLQWKL